MLFTACSWGLTWPQSKYLLTMLPPFSMRATGGLLGCGFAFLVALLRRERLWPPADQWPRLIVFSMLNYGLFIVLANRGAGLFEGLGGGGHHLHAAGLGRTAGVADAG